MSIGGYVRHRDRMVQESVFEDLQNTLIACRWMSGTTTRQVIDPYNPGAGWQIVTTALSDVLKLVGKREDGTTAEIVLIDYFPEAGGNDDEEGESRKTEKNTLAIDTGQPQDPTDMELGSNMIEVQYVFTMAFYASSDAVAMALMNDLRDRYQGRIVSDDRLNLYNFNDDEIPLVFRMECDYFKYQQNVETVSPWEVHMYFGELALTDVVDPEEVGRPAYQPDPGDPVVLTGVGVPDVDGDEGDEYIDLETGDVYEWSD